MTVWLLLGVLAGGYAWSVWRLARVGSPPRGSEDNVTIRVAGRERPESGSNDSNLSSGEGAPPPGIVGRLHVLHTTLRSLHGHRHAR
jgi:hypothetical protein